LTSLLIRGAETVTSSGVELADVLIVDGKISRIGNLPSRSAGKTIEARGLTLMPGVIDPHVHFREPGQTWKEDLESGSRAAAAGGVTAFLDMPNNDPPVTTVERLREKFVRAAAKCHVDFGFFFGATPDNLEEIPKAIEACGVKIFMGSSTGSLLVHRREDLERIFASGRKLIAVHAEDEDAVRANRAAWGDSATLLDHPRIRSVETALKATRLAVELSKRHRRRLHILHLTTQEEVEFLAREKTPGVISTEVCPQHFLLRHPEAYESLGTLAQMNPPIRETRHGEALWKALQSGVIDCLATDHAPHTLEEKARPYPQSPSGMPGVETLLPVMLNRVNQGLCSLSDLARWMCEGPARLYGMAGKGSIKAGYDADLVLVDMKAERTVRNGHLQTKVNWSPYHGWNLKGWPVMTLVRGNIVYQEGEFPVAPSGRPIRFAPEWEKENQQRH
jgi:dihydroorotase